MKKKGLFFAIALAVIGVSALAGAESASAASAFDNTLVPRTNIHMDLSSPSSYCSDDKEYLDLTIKWPEIFYGGEMTNEFSGTDSAWSYRWNNGHDSSTYEDYMNGWNTKTYWGVMQDDAPGSAAYIWWTDDPDAYGEFNGTALPGYSGLDVITPTAGKKVWGVALVMDTGYNCDISVTKFMDGTTGQDNFYAGYNYGDGSNARKPLFIYLDDLRYPEGYEGEDIPDSTPLPADESDWTPDMYVSVATDWKATFYDKNFFTFDQVPFLCSDELAPALHIEIWDRSADPEVLIQTGAFSANAEWTYQFEKKPTSNDYRIVAWYECGEEPIFTDSSFYDFTINGVGSLVSTTVQSCLTEAFPFFDYDACIASMNDTLALLTFQIANPVNEGVLGMSTANPNSCHTMGTLGSWINRPGQTLCPAFSETVRNTITPFITFALAGIVFYYISRGARQVI